MKAHVIINWLGRRRFYHQSKGQKRCTYYLVSQLFLVAQLLCSHLMLLNLICPHFCFLCFFFQFVILPCTVFPDITLMCVCSCVCLYLSRVFPKGSNWWLIRGQGGSDIPQKACHAFKSREKEPNPFNLQHLQGGQSTQSAPLLLLGFSVKYWQDCGCWSSLKHLCACVVFVCTCEYTYTYQMLQKAAQMEKSRKWTGEVIQRYESI